MHDFRTVRSEYESATRDVRVRGDDGGSGAGVSIAFVADIAIEPVIGRPAGSPAGGWCGTLKG